MNLIVFVGSGLLALAILSIAVIGGSGRPAALFMAAALCYLIGVIGVTAVFNIPLNDALAAAPSGDAALRWPAYVTAWLRWNHVRTIAAILSLLCYLLAAYQWPRPGAVS